MTEATHPPAFEAPEIGYLAAHFPGYDFVDLIACGGMGAVYQAVQRSLERTVAIKILPRDFGADASFRAGFEAEAKAMAKLNHPNLIGVYDFGEVDGMLFIVMEYVAGGSLYQAAYGIRLDQREAARIVAAACDGLAHAHEHGILHRDIKPANILLDLQARPKIGDFGLARPIGLKEGKDDTVFGTPHYTAPEVLARPEAVDARADIFSIGVVLHELLTGQVPAADPRPASMISRCDLRFDEIIRNATNPMSEMRYPDAAMMAEELHTLEQSIGRATQPVSLRAPRGGTASASPVAASPRAPGPMRRPGGSVTAYTVRRKSEGTSGVFTTILILTAVIIGSYFLVKSGSVNIGGTPPDPVPVETPVPDEGTNPKPKRPVPRVVPKEPEESSEFGTRTPPRVGQ